MMRAAKTEQKKEATEAQMSSYGRQEDKDAEKGVGGNLRASGAPVARRLTSKGRCLLRWVELGWVGLGEVGEVVCGGRIVPPYRASYSPPSPE